MRLPRRVPWVSLADLDQVCSWIYADDADWGTKTRALHRLSAWNNITPLPHALEACLSILAVTIQDNEQSSKPSSSRQGAAIFSLRQNYSVAIIRMVNGLVDPLQQGAYARSIASIAAQIGIPQWLVELRHAATHEELPSLELLRNAAHEAMAWLLHNYFLPTLSPPAPLDATTSTRQLTPIDPYLKEYKKLLKTIVRDTSLKSRFKPDVSKILRNIDRWISEAKLAAPGSFFDDLDTIDREEIKVDPSEKWALDRLCGTLLQKGFLVPVSSKKRISDPVRGDGARLRLPDELVEIWLPLLTDIQSNHPYLAKALTDNILSLLLSRPQNPTHSNPPPATYKDQTYELCLAAWAAWLVKHNDSSPKLDNGFGGGSVTGLLRREDIVIALASALGASALGVDVDHDEVVRLSDDRRGARALLDHLSQDDRNSAQIASSLLLFDKLPLNRDAEQQLDNTWTDQDAKVMEDRLAALLKSAITRPPSNIDHELNGTTSEALKTNLSHSVPVPDDFPEGWSIIPESVWGPCPFGTCNV